MRYQLTLFAFILLAVSCLAQNGNTVAFSGAGAPTGSCAFMFIYTNTSNGDFYNCLNGSWNKVTSAGGGGNVSTTQTNVYGAFLQDFTAATMELPEAAAFVSTVDSTVGFDTNTQILHMWGPSAADSFNVVTSSTSTTATQPIFATATAGLYAPRAIAAADIPSGTVTLDKVGGAAAAGTITESAVLRPVTFAGVETANLTYPIVFQNTNSTNSNTSGAALVNCAGSDASPTCLMVNVPLTSALAISVVGGGTVTNGVVSGQTAEWSVAGNGTTTQTNNLTLTGGVATVPAGAVGAATYAFAGDTAGAGFYRAGAVTYGITNASNEVLRLASTGVRGNSGSAYGMTSSATSSVGSYDTCWDRQGAGVMRVDANSGCNDGLGKVQAQLYTTTTNCAAAGSAANPSVAACGAASSGSFSCATNASTGTCVVNTTAVTANSVIIIQEDDSLGTKLSVTCNTSNISPASAPISARSAATSFTINLGTITTNPECFSYLIIN